MAAILGEELLGAEAAGAGAEGAVGGQFQYSGGGIGGAYYGGLLDTEGSALGGTDRYFRYGRGEEGDGSSSSFKEDKKPKSVNWGDAYNTAFVSGQIGNDINGITTAIGNIYGMYRNSKKIGLKREENT